MGHRICPLHLPRVEFDSATPSTTPRVEQMSDFIKRAELSGGRGGHPPRHIQQCIQLHTSPRQRCTDQTSCSTVLDSYHNRQECSASRTERRRNPISLALSPRSSLVPDIRTTLDRETTPAPLQLARSRDTKPSGVELGSAYITLACRSSILPLTLNHTFTTTSQHVAAAGDHHL